MTAPSPLYRTLRELAANYHYEKHTSSIIRLGDPPRIGFFECTDGVCARAVQILQADLDREPTYTAEQVRSAGLSAIAAVRVPYEDGSGMLTGGEMVEMVLHHLTTNG